MVVEITPIASLYYEKVHYYTVRFGNRAVSEFRNFIARMSGNARDAYELAEINRYIQLIGKEYGAYPQHFKNEDAAERLPPPYHQFIEADSSFDYGLRLYCIRLSPSVVILLNGDRKTALKAKDCKNCYPHFDRARRIARNITQAIQEGNMEIDEYNKEILLDNDFELEI